MLTDNFITFWNNTLKPSAINAIDDGIDLVAEYNSTDDEDKKNEITTKMTFINRVDWIVVFKISELIVLVDNAIKNEENPAYRFYEIYMKLQDEKYYNTFFKDNLDCEEVKKYKILIKNVELGLDMLK
jgi:ATP-dependent Zn protease